MFFPLALKVYFYCKMKACKMKACKAPTNLCQGIISCAYYNKLPKKRQKRQRSQREYDRTGIAGAVLRHRKGRLRLSPQSQVNYIILLSYIFTLCASYVSNYFTMPPLTTTILPLHFVCFLFLCLQSVFYIDTA